MRGGKPKSRPELHYEAASLTTGFPCLLVCYPHWLTRRVTGSCKLFAFAIEDIDSIRPPAILPSRKLQITIISQNTPQWTR